MKRLLRNCRLAPTGGGGALEAAALVIEDGRILWAGEEASLPPAHRRAKADDLGGRLVTPGLIDCHSHIVFGGNRAREFELRLEGASYAEIARQGGGILSTMQATRAASEEQLIATALPRLDALIAGGVTTIEIKSGYGLDIKTELKMLRAARALGRLRPVNVITSWLAAHALPPEYKDSGDEYIERVAIPGLRQAHAEGLVDAVDGFCESIAFSPDQIARLFQAARELGLPVKLHAEQLSNLGGAELVARFKGLSADHLEYLDPAGVRAMADAGTVAVLLPGAFYTLRETRVPPVEALRKAGVPMAVASDGNPGSSPLFSLLLAMNMACTLFRLTPSEALAGATTHAARALGLSDRGVLAKGMRADLAVWDVIEPAELAYGIGFNPLHARYFGGRADA